MELKQYFNVLFKWWWLILASVGIASGASYLGTLATPRQYMSHTTLMVGQSLQNPNPDQSQFYMSQALAQSYTDLVRREPVLRGTLDALKLDWDWLLLQSMVTARVIPGTQLLEISVFDTDPLRATVLASEIAQQLILQTPAAMDVEREAEHQFILQQVQDLKANITKAQSEVRLLDSVIAQANSARQIQDARSQQSALQTQVASWQATYAQLLTNLQGSSTNFLSVVEPAREPNGWVGATTASNILLAALIGFVLAASAAYTVKTSEDVRKVVDLPTLGGVGQLDGPDYATQLITVHQPRSSVAEAYRALRTNIQFSTVDEPVRTLMLTSANPQDGKTITAANLAVTLAQSGQRVILVDADLRRPSQHKVFGSSLATGLTTILLDANVPLANVLQTTEVENLRVVAGGPVPPNPSEILGSKRMGYLIEALQQETDVVIFDSPPLLAVTDAAVLGARLDAVLIVVSASHTRRIHLQRAKEALDAVGAHVIGVALNRVSTHSDSYYHHYYADDSDDQPTRRGARLRAALAESSLVRRFARHPDSPSAAAVTHAAPRPAKPTNPRARSAK
jgi:succinoglycan biosynthesis transport protein ExoP